MRSFQPNTATELRDVSWKASDSPITDIPYPPFPTSGPPISPSTCQLVVWLIQLVSMKDFLLKHNRAMQDTAHCKSFVCSMSPPSKTFLKRPSCNILVVTHGLHFRSCSSSRELILSHSYMTFVSCQSQSLNSNKVKLPICLIHMSFM